MLSPPAKAPPAAAPEHKTLERRQAKQHSSRDPQAKAIHAGHRLRQTGSTTRDKLWEVVIATSRTGTATWKRISRQAKKLARANGQTRCPHCGVTLNYDVGLTPCSAEADHIIPHAKGGRDELSNVIVICRRCNQSKGNRVAPKMATVMAAKPLKTSRRW